MRPFAVSATATCCCFYSSAGRGLLFVSAARRGLCAGCERSVPLGMISGEIKDWQLSTSSTYPTDWDRTCHERYARLYQPDGRAWCAKYKTASEWIQIDLGVAAKARMHDVYSRCLPTRSDLIWSLAVLHPRVGHTMDVLSPFILVLCHSDWLFHRESCPRLDVVHPGRAWPSSPSCTWHCSLHYLFLKATPLFPHGVTIVC